jgi:hypothetical protein
VHCLIADERIGSEKCQPSPISAQEKHMSLDSRQHYFELLPKGNPVTTHDSSSADDFLVRLVDGIEKVFGSTSELIWVRKV